MLTASQFPAAQRPSLAAGGSGRGAPAAAAAAAAATAAAAAAALLAALLGLGAAAEREHQDDGQDVHPVLAEEGLRRRLRGRGGRGE